MKPLTPDEWTQVLKNVGLTETTVNTNPIKIQEEKRVLVRYYGFVGMIKVMRGMILLFPKSPANRMFLKEVRQTGVLLEHLEEYFGYGLFVAREKASYWRL